MAKRGRDDERDDKKHGKHKSKPMPKPMHMPKSKPKAPAFGLSTPPGGGDSAPMPMMGDGEDDMGME